MQDFRTLSSSTMDSATWARTDLLLTLGELSVISEMWEIERLVEGAPGTNFVEIKSVYDQTLHRAEQWSSWLVLLPSPPMIFPSLLCISNEFVSPSPVSLFTALPKSALLRSICVLFPDCESYEGFLLGKKVQNPRKTLIHAHGQYGLLITGGNAILLTIVISWTCSH